MGFHQPPSTIIFKDPPHSQTTPPISPRIQQKMRNRCKHNYIEAFGSVYWAKNAVLKNLAGLQQLPFAGRGLKLKLAKQ